MQAEIDRFADDGSLDDNVESFLSHEEADQREPLFSCNKRSPTTGQNMDVSKGLFSLAYFINLCISSAFYEEILSGPSLFPLNRIFFY